MKRMFLIVTAIVCLVVGGMGTATAQTTTSIPQQISYQGVLTQQDGRTIVPDGVYTITFRIFTDQTTLNSIWQETQTSVQVQNGIFSVNLGSVSPLSIAFDRQYWLGINIISGAVRADFTDRIQFTSTPYAIRSRNAEHLITPNTPTDGQTLRWSASQNRWVASNSGSSLVWRFATTQPNGSSQTETRVNTWVPYLTPNGRSVSITVPESGIYLVSHQAFARLDAYDNSNANRPMSWEAGVFNVTRGAFTNVTRGGESYELTNVASNQIVVTGAHPLSQTSSGSIITFLNAGEVLELQLFVSVSTATGAKGPVQYGSQQCSFSIIKISDQ